MNVRGRWLKRPTAWRKISLQTWRTPDNPTIHGTLEIDVGPLQEFLARRSAESGVKCTMTHAVSRALAVLLRRHPDCNVLVRRRKIWLRDDVDVFHQVAMPSETEPGRVDLSGATIRKADTKRIEAIAEELRARAAAVRQEKDGDMARTRSMLLRLPGFLTRWVLRLVGWLQYTLNLRVPTTPRDPFGGAMVTSVGMMGIKSAFVPLVTFSRVPIIVVVGQVEDRPVVRDGQVVVRPMCTLTATMDHRVLDGAQAAQLAAGMTRLLEEPERLDEALGAAAAPPGG